jgi:hypothetical protein
MIITVNGRRFPACGTCGKRPRRPRPVQLGKPKRWWPDCAVCHAAAVRQWRAENKLTADEWRLILELRQAMPAGKHHAGS